MTPKELSPCCLQRSFYAIKLLEILPDWNVFVNKHPPIKSLKNSSHEKELIDFHTYSHVSYFIANIAFLLRVTWETMLTWKDLNFACVEGNGRHRNWRYPGAEISLVNGEVWRVVWGTWEKEGYCVPMQVKVSS